MFGVAAVVSQIGSAPVDSPHMSSDVGFVSNPFIDPNALPSPGDLSTLKESLMSPPFPLGVPGRIGGAELPEY